MRLTGREAIDIASKVFFSHSRNENIHKFKSHTLHYGEIRDGTYVLDDVVLGIMKSPHSYTGEDMVEITCHGGYFILSKIMALLLRKGAIAAQPGEFTKRAFLNGKMDLSQAESVNMLIHSRSEKSHRQSMRLLKGSLKKKINDIKNAVIEVKASLDADIEWGETDKINTLTKSEMRKILTRVEKTIEDILSESILSRQLIAGFNVVISGMPNAGKSSLFNCILDMDRSIINKMPGTTRDVIECDILTGGFLIKLTDTAGVGLNNTSEIEKSAVNKSKKAISDADIIIYIIDGKEGIRKKDFGIKRLFYEKEWIPVINKCDLNLNINDEEITNFCDGRNYYEISCKERTGIDKLKKRIKEILQKEETDKMMITIRQREAFCAALNGIVKVEKKLSYPEIASYELQEAIKSLGRIDGSFIELENDIIEKIFADFCIGK